MTHHVWLVALTRAPINLFTLGPAEAVPPLAEGARERKELPAVRAHNNPAHEKMRELMARR